MKEQSNNTSCCEEDNNEKSQVKLNVISPEGYKDYTIFEIKDVSPFNHNKFEILNNQPYYLKRNIINQFLNSENSITPYLEILLDHDDTFDRLQSFYLDQLIIMMNKRNFDDDTKSKITEKIQKCSIILSQDIYDNKIKELNIKEAKEFKYINYKENITKAFEYILTLQKKTISESDIIRAKNILNIKKIFNFCREPELGDNNYYFYKLALRFYNSMDELFIMLHYINYFYFIQKIIDILKEPFDKNKNEFRYLINLVFDKELLATNSHYKEAKNVIESQDIQLNELEKKIKKIKKTKLDFFQDFIKYDIDLDSKNNKIVYTVNDKTKIGKNNYIKLYKREFNLGCFNKGILKILKDDLSDLENDIFKCVKFDNQYFFEYYKPFLNAFNNTIRKILKSKAAVAFFNDKYKSTYKNITYHFNNDEVIDEILKKISFAPIFSQSVNAYTDPTDLSITINSIPGRYGKKKMNIYNKKILQLGRIILFALHEIMGHYMRRYYSYLTRGIIAFNTEDDNALNTGIESGDFIESEFLGFNTVNNSNLTLSDTLCLLYCDGFDNYPIEKKKQIIFNKEILENIINNNRDIFDFIGEKTNQISFQDYSSSLTPIKTDGNHRVSHKYINEDYIILKEKYL